MEQRERIASLEAKVKVLEIELKNRPNAQTLTSGSMSTVDQKPPLAVPALPSPFHELLTRVRAIPNSVTALQQSSLPRIFPFFRTVDGIPPTGTIVPPGRVTSEYLPEGFDSTISREELVTAALHWHTDQPPSHALSIVL